MIGIISHRAELTDRLSGCIVVQKGVAESRDGWLNGSDSLGAAA